jgi:hypothetical protein
VEGGHVRKAVGQVSLVEALLPAAFGSNQRLERIRAQVDWAPIEVLLQPMRRALTGRPAYPPLVQLKALLLQHLRGLLTAPALQAALPFLLARVPLVGSRPGGGACRSAELPAVLRAGSGRRGTGCDNVLALSDRSGRGGPGGSGFASLNAQLEQRGLFIKAGTMIDAILVEADVKRPPMREGRYRSGDPATGFTRKGQRSYFGDQAHLAVDHRSSC